MDKRRRLVKDYGIEEKEEVGQKLWYRRKRGDWSEVMEIGLRLAGRRKGGDWSDAMV